MIQIGIIGGAGYTAGELIRILLYHSKAAINFVYSTSNSGNKVSNIHQDLVGSTDLIFTDKVNAEVDVVFLCLGHGNSKAFLKQNTFSYLFCFFWNPQLQLASNSEWIDCT